VTANGGGPNTSGAYQPGDVTYAYAYFDQNIWPTLGDTPKETVARLRDDYLQAVLLNRAAIEQLREWASDSGDSRTLADDVAAGLHDRPHP
jgi:hypothetical protein